LKEIVVMKFGGSDWIVPGVAAAAFLAMSAFMATSPTLAATGPAPAAPANSGAAPGKAVFEELCGNCHDLAVTTDQRKSRDGWQTTVTRMVSSGAALTDEQAAQVIDYLTKNYGTS
jgi:cytochrome c5